MADPITEAFNALVSLLGGGSYPLYPDPNYLQGKSSPDLSKVWIRSNGLLCQGREEQQGKKLPIDQLYHDGGDSSQKTGMAAFANSSLDKKQLPRFLLPNARMICRNPDQDEWRDPAKTSRDQLIQYAAGCWRAGQSGIVKTLLDGLGGSLGLVGKDVLRPDNLMYLRACAGHDPRRDLIGQFFLTVAIEADDESEINGLMVQSIVCGRLNEFVWAHPTYPKLLEEYWGSRAHPWSEGRRGQPEIAEALIKAVELELKRYPDYASIGKWYPTIKRLFRLALGDLPSYAAFARHLYEKYRNDPKSLFFMLIGADPKATIADLEVFVRDYSLGLVQRAEDAVAIVEAVCESFGGLGINLDPEKCRPHRAKRKSRLRFLQSAVEWHEADIG